MSNGHDDDDDDDNTVGYCRPPKATRFKKNQSGNPNGGSAKQRARALARQTLGSHAAMVNRVAAEIVTVTKNGKPVKMDTAEAYMRKSVADGLKGNARAHKWVANEFEKARLLEDQSREELIAFFINYQRDARHAIRVAEAIGKEPPLIVPHPDDIIIDIANRTVRIVGPGDDATYKAMQDILAVRNRYADMLPDLQRQYRRARNPSVKEMLVHDMQLVTKRARYINDRLPPRYRGR